MMSRANETIWQALRCGGEPGQNTGQNTGQTVLVQDLVAHGGAAWALPRDVPMPIATYDCARMAKSLIGDAITPYGSSARLIWFSGYPSGEWRRNGNEQAYQYRAVGYACSFPH